ncbi:MAG: type I secretion system permease/ATPase, partial [Pseudomonadota bacterium]
YGSPKLIVLDEPNSNLDDQGELALRMALATCKQNNATTIVISHRKSLLADVDKLMLVNEGQVMAFGPRDEVLTKLNAANTQTKGAQALAVAGGQAGKQAQIKKS